MLTFNQHVCHGAPVKHSRHRYPVQSRGWNRSAWTGCRRETCVELPTRPDPERGRPPSYRHAVRRRSPSGERSGPATRTKHVSCLNAVTAVGVGTRAGSAHEACMLLSEAGRVRGRMQSWGVRVRRTGSLGRLNRVTGVAVEQGRWCG
eukprot:IDg5029t1